MTSPADELRAAAARLRTLTTAATPGTWRAEELPPDEDHSRPAHWVNTEYTTPDGTTTYETVADCPWRQADADYIAAMQPAVGAALADWLDAAARAHDAAVKAAAGVWPEPHEAAERDAWIAGQTDQPALAVAHALLDRPEEASWPARRPPRPGSAPEPAPAGKPCCAAARAARRSNNTPPDGQNSATAA